MLLEKICCRICFSDEKLKLLSLFEVKIDGLPLSEMVNYLAGEMVRFTKNTTRKNNFSVLDYF